MQKRDQSLFSKQINKKKLNINCIYCVNDNNFSENIWIN